MTTDPRPGSTVGGLSVRTRITIAVSLLAGLALAGAGLVVYAVESAHIQQEVSDQIDQELTEFDNLRAGVDPDTGEGFTDVTRLLVVPGLVELEVAVPRLTPALR